MKSTQLIYTYTQIQHQAVAFLTITSLVSVPTAHPKSLGFKEQIATVINTLAIRGNSNNQNVINPKSGPFPCLSSLSLYQRETAYFTINVKDPYAFVKV